MAFVTSSWLIDLLVLAVLAACAFYYYITATFNHWKNLGVPYIKPVPFYGNIKDVILKKVSYGETLIKLYNEKPEYGYLGIYQARTPVFMPRSPELIKAITGQDFDHFSDRRSFLDENIDPIIARGLFNLDGEQWKNMRTKLTPAFTPGKLKNMLPLMNANGQLLASYFEEIARNGREIEMKETLARFTTDVIGSCAFGVECNSLKDPEAPFHKMGQKLVTTEGVRFFLTMLIYLFPKFCKMLGIRFVPKDVTNFFTSVVFDTLEYREKNTIQRPDFMQMMSQLRKGKTIVDDNIQKEEEKGEAKASDHVTEKGISDMDILAQSLTFFLGGFETSSSLMSFMSYELAVHPDIQERLREEIVTVIDKHGGELTYEALQEMEYMDRVVSETLRRYPPILLLERIVTKKYRIPESNITLDKGQVVEIPTYALHHDPKYYPEPYRFDPDRFTEEANKERPQVVYQPFGIGPRNCIGKRFGLMQVKVGMSYILKNYEIVPGPKTVIPLRLDKSNMNVRSEGGIWLKLKKL